MAPWCPLEQMNMRRFMQDQLEWFKWMWGAIFVPFILHLYKKIEKSVDRDEYNQTIKSLRETINTGNRDISERMDKIMTIMIEKK